jgi:2-oxoglutarate ferredoxin oxidoreductase subunit alpha
MERLLKKFETAKRYVPGPSPMRAAQPTRIGVIHYGSTGPAMDEAAAAGRRRRASRCDARARLSLLRRGVDFIAATSASSSSSRTATRSCAACC